MEFHRAPAAEDELSVLESELFGDAKSDEQFTRFMLAQPTPLVQLPPAEVTSVVGASPVAPPAIVSEVPSFFNHQFMVGMVVGAAVTVLAGAALGVYLNQKKKVVAPAEPWHQERSRFDRVRVRPVRPYEGSALQRWNIERAEKRANGDVE